MIKTKLFGMTLIELMIALSIVAILAVISIYSYSSYIRSGRRADGINALMSISLAQERYRSNNTQYGTLAQVWSGVTTSPGGYYTLAISGVSSTAYTITATAIGTQANDAVSGTSCATLTLSMSSGTLTRTPAACWPT
jgi:type IV pilus assembly protein PilE